VKNESLQSRLRERLERAPHGRALAFYKDTGEFSWICFEELYGRAARLAGLLASHGLGRGEVCIVVLPSGEAAAITTLAVLIRGAVPLLVAPPVVAGSLLDLPRILKRTAAKTNARLVLCARAMENMRAELQQGLEQTGFLFDLAEPDGDSPAVECVLPGPHDVAAMQLTSGTTGFPRICVWNQRAVLAALDGMTEAMGLSERDVCVNWTPLYHDMGLVNNFLQCLTTDVPLVLLSPDEFVKRPALWLRSLSDTGATVSWSPNFGFALAAQRVNDDELAGVRLDGVHSMWNAAERIHHDTVAAFCKRYRPYGLRPDAVRTNFGCAENVGGATFSDRDGPFVIDRVDREALLEKRVALPVPGHADPAAVITVVGVGRPHAGIEVEILSEDGQPLADGRVGEIALRTPSRMLGYLDDEPATSQALVGDLLRTGDLGYRRGRELYWVGRTRERITLRGKKLDPSDFEPILLAVEGLRAGCFVAFGVDDPQQGTQRVVIVSEVREPTARSTRELSAAIQRQAFVRLGVRVSEVLLVRPGTLAKTSSGKRRHRHFRRLYLEGELQSIAAADHGCN